MVPFVRTVYVMLPGKARKFPRITFVNWTSAGSGRDKIRKAVVPDEARLPKSNDDELL